MIAKVVFMSMVYLASSSALYGLPSYGPGIIDTKPEPYQMSFNVQDEYGTTLLREEQGDELGNKRGSYGYVDAHGISRQVDYVADEHGFRAVVKTNEPGTDNQNPADVEIISSAAPAALGSGPVSSYGRPALSPAYRQPLSAAYGPGPIVAAAIPLGPVQSSSSLRAPLRSYGSIKPVAPIY